MNGNKIAKSWYTYADDMKVKILYNYIIQNYNFHNKN